MIEGGLNLEYVFRLFIDLIMGVNLPASLDALSSFYNGLKIVGVLVSLAVVSLAIYVEMQMHKMHHEEHERIHALLGHGHGHGGHSDDHGHGSHDDHGDSHADAHGAHGSGDSHGHVPTKAELNPKWTKIETYINSQNPNDWRLAILEADIVLDEMLSKMSYHGETVSDKLKAVEPSDFLTLNSAWEAHKIRNAIAHEGSDFLISEREARRVVKLYEAVFKEFHFI